MPTPLPHNLRARDVFGAVLVGVLFVGCAYLSVKYQDTLRSAVSTIGMWGILVYIAIAFFSTVIAPISSTPLIPIASALWGPVIAGIATTVGWTTGSIVAFYLARSFGYTWVQRFTGTQELQGYGRAIPERNLFWSVVFVRIVLPVDLISYLLGLFTTMRMGAYALATLLGTLPFAFIFAYAARMPLWVQGAVLAAAGSIMLAAFRRIQTKLAATVDQEPETHAARTDNDASR